MTKWLKGRIIQIGFLSAGSGQIIESKSNKIYPFAGNAVDPGTELVKGDRVIFSPNTQGCVVRVKKKESRAASYASSAASWQVRDRTSPKLRHGQIGHAIRTKRKIVH